MANIPGTNVPAPTFGDRGFVMSPAAAILAGVQADYDTAFGQTLNYQLTTPQGQLSSSTAALVANMQGLFVYYTNQLNPDFATGRMQDAIGNYYFLRRIGSLPTTLVLICAGAQGVSLPEQQATVVDPSGNLFVAVATAVIDAGGTVSATFACTLSGPTEVPETVSIYRAIPGWDSATVSSGTQGRDTESRSAFEERRRESVAGNSFGAASSVLGAVARVAGVTDYWGYDNATNAPVTVSGVTIAANSIFIAVSGGDDDDVAQAIISKKGPGCSYTGNTTVTVYDQNPLYASPPSYEVKFERPTNLQINFAVIIAAGPNVPADATALIQVAIIAAAEGQDGGQRARIATTIYASRYVTPIAALGAWAQIKQLTVGSQNTPISTFTGTIAAQILTVSGVSGTIAIGQYVTGVGVAPGTFIVGGSGTTWGINISQTVGPVAMKGSTSALMQVDVQGDQEPVVAAGTIGVAVS